MKGLRVFIVWRDEREAGVVCVEVFSFPKDPSIWLEDEKAGAADE